MDGRKRRYVPLSLTFAHGDTGTYLLQTLGRDGLLTWVCLIAAAKRHDPEGEFEWYGEEDAWRQLGLGAPFTPPFTFAEFLAVTGRAKQTRKTRNRGAGRCQHVVLTRYGDWNKTWKRRTGDGQKPSTDGENADEIPAECLTDANQIPPPELELEVELEKEVRANALTGKPRKPDLLWDTLVAEIGPVANDAERKKYNAALKLIREANGTPDELRERINRYRIVWPNVSLTAHGVATNWTLLGKPLPPSVTSNGRNEGMTPAEIVAYTKGRA